MVRKTKNIIKRELTDSEGVVFYSFLSLASGPIWELEEHINNLILSSQPYNTVKAKASDLAKFYDFFIEASNILHTDIFQEELTKNRSYSSNFHLRTTITNIFNAYPSFLLDGHNSRNPLAKACALSLEITPLARTSVKRMISSLCEFITSSNSLEYSLIQQRKIDGIINVEQPFVTLAKELNTLRKLPSMERKALIEHSYLAACISGGAKVARVKNFFKLPPQPTVIKEKHFPIDRIGHFLLSTKSHRDRCLYALCFGGGLRFSEATKVRFCDLDVLNERVKLHGKEFVEYLQAIDYRKASGKHVEHYTVHFIEPFKSFFFDELTKYLQKERPGSNSEYVFLQSRAAKNKHTGLVEYSPYYRSSKSTIKEAWDLNLKRANLANSRFDTINGTHSMRHFYGVYMTNYAPNPRGGMGYSLNEMQHLMRHAELKSTKVYILGASCEQMMRDIELTNRLLLQREADFYSNNRNTRYIPIILSEER